MDVKSIQAKKRDVNSKWSKLRSTTLQKHPGQMGEKSKASKLRRGECTSKWSMLRRGMWIQNDPSHEGDCSKTSKCWEWNQFKMIQAEGKDGCQNDPSWREESIEKHPSMDTDFSKWSKLDGGRCYSKWSKLRSTTLQKHPSHAGRKGQFKSIQAKRRRWFKMIQAMRDDVSNDPS